MRSKSTARHRFPRQRYIRELDDMLHEWRWWTAESRRLADTTDGYAAALLVQRAQLLDELWHEVEPVLRSLAWMR